MHGPCQCGLGAAAFNVAVAINSAFGAGDNLVGHSSAVQEQHATINVRH